MTALQACEVVPILQILIVIGIIRMLRRIVAVTVHSHALAASALHTPLNCHPTLTPVSLSAGFSSIALALVSITPRSLPTKTAGLVSYKH
jgi:hypothetical protein